MRNRIRDVRLDCGLTQKQVSERVAAMPGGSEMDQSTLSKIETGEKNPSVDMLFRIAEALSCPVADLLVDQDNPDRIELDRVKESARPLTDGERALLQAFRDSKDSRKDEALRMALLILSDFRDFDAA